VDLHPRHHLRELTVRCSTCSVYLCLYYLRRSKMPSWGYQHSYSNPQRGYESMR